MANDLKTAASKLITALDTVAKAIENYGAAALAVGVESGNPTERGFDARQVRWRIKAEVVGRLSPKKAFGLPAPWLVLDGAPEARRYIAANPLPGTV